MLIDDVQQAMFAAMKARRIDETGALRLALNALRTATKEPGRGARALPARPAEAGRARPPGRRGDRRQRCLQPQGARQGHGPGHARRPRPRRRQPGPPARPGAPPGLRPPRQGPPPPPPPEPSLTCSRTTVPGGASVPALGDWPTTRPAGALLCTVCAEAL